MSNHYIVSMHSKGATATLHQAPHREATGNIKSFVDKRTALEYAASNKDRYEIVTVKGQDGNLLVKYHDGSKV